MGVSDKTILKMRKNIYLLFHLQCSSILKLHNSSGRQYPREPINVELTFGTSFCISCIDIEISCQTSRSSRTPSGQIISADMKQT